MKGQGDALSEDQRRMLATFMSGRPLGSLQQGDAKRHAQPVRGQSSAGRPRSRPRVERMGRGPWQHPLSDRRKPPVSPPTRCRT